MHHSRNGRQKNLLDRSLVRRAKAPDYQAMKPKSESLTEREKGQSFAQSNASSQILLLSLDPSWTTRTVFNKLEPSFDEETPASPQSFQNRSSRGLFAMKGGLPRRMPTASPSHQSMSSFAVTFNRTQKKNTRSAPMAPKRTWNSGYR